MIEGEHERPFSSLGADERPPGTSGHRTATRPALFMRRALTPLVRQLVSTWYGTFLVDGTAVLRSALAPTDPAALAERAARRRRGELTPEEEQLLRERGADAWTSGDRRLLAHGLEPVASGAATPSIPAPPDPGLLREALLRDAERALAEAWDPSVHVEEAVRADADLDRVRNLVGERLGSWASRDAPELDPGDHAAAARSALRPPTADPSRTVPAGLLDARRSLAELYRSIEATQRALTEAIATSVPSRAPNLNALLGPDLAARLLAQAGGLDRLARLPASTIQVLGAERAFFDHLRRGTPPPRHGLLFLHPSIQSAPRSDRGKLARALAGKVAIAARLDRAGAAVDPGLGRAFDRRRDELTARRSAGGTGRAKRRLRPPLDGAARDH